MLFLTTRFGQSCEFSFPWWKDSYYCCITYYSILFIACFNRFRWVLTWCCSRKPIISLSYPTYSARNILFTVLENDYNIISRTLWQQQIKNTKRHENDSGIGAPWYSEHLTRAGRHGCVSSAKILVITAMIAALTSLLSSSLLALSHSPFPLELLPSLDYMGMGRRGCGRGEGCGWMGRGTRGVTLRLLRSLIVIFFPHSSLAGMRVRARGQSEGQGWQG